MQAATTAIITGGTSGIGHQLVRKVISSGMSCIFVGSSPESVQESLHMLIAANDFPKDSTTKHQFVRGVSIDLSNWPSWTAEQTFKSWEFSPTNCIIGPFTTPLFNVSPRNPCGPSQKYTYSLLVNCAGITQKSLTHRSTTIDMARIMNINLMSLMSLTQLSVRPMLKSQRNSKATSPIIVNVASYLGHPDTHILPGTAIYAASKSAVLQYTYSLRPELSRLGIRIEAIAPGIVRGTKMIETLPPDSQKSLLHAKPHLQTTPHAVADLIWSIYCSSPV
ncbi:3-oxoacyl-[acyl-carrier-protein] reductase (NADPH) Ecym_4561 [Eremothecium cymbalariae DBVPG|uniref:3-oxoacyl-[acyl-carrier-protein] reductase n=1 Tax=Eremothecium cymbalariae (strain CBS 270.75 / DBVPG 7215 / KCTC 17166 / NRRL Y-17582) TaxID=931890 RepID=G8JU91_ERECY|nr:hypothetical protein Ecym_4561 [Eremothecium cymbalariae DBVPG\